MIVNLTTKVSELRQELKGLVEVQQKLIHVQLGAPIPPKPKEYGEEVNNSSKIQITNTLDGKSIKVSGKTYDYMSLIKEAGPAKFEKDTKSWILPMDSLDSLVQKLQCAKMSQGKDYTLNVVVNTEVETNMFE